MAFAHEPLTEAELGPAAAKMAGPAAPAPMKMAVARGMAPLPPRDLLVAMYQFWAENDPKLAETASKTLTTLPPQILGGALSDPKLPAGVIDFMSRKLLRDEKHLELIVRHQNVDDETLVGVARVCPEGICDVLAENQVRWIRTPAIVVSLYYNRNCRMSTVQRMLEFAEREDIEIKLPNMEEIRTAMKETGAADPGRDQMFKSALSSEVQDQEIDRIMEAKAEEDLEEVLDDVDATDDPEAEAARVEEANKLADEVMAQADGAGDDGDERPTADDSAEAEDAEGVDIVKVRQTRMQQITQMNPMEKIRAALLGDAYDRSVLVRDSNKVVALSAIKSPKIKESEVVGLSANRALSHDVIRYIANRRDWIKLYTVKLNLVMNPKTPMAKSMSILPFLNNMDVKKVARSKNVPAALAKAAKRKTDNRR